jgi:hypothetical protein
MKYFILVLFVAAAACKNKSIDKAPEFPADLYITKVNKKAGIRLFINKVEIKDKAVIDAFVAGERNFHVESRGVTAEDKISFLSADTASMENLYNKMTVSKTGDQFIFRSVSDHWISPNDTRQFFYMYKYRTEPTRPRYDGKLAVNMMVVGHGDYSNVELSVFNYKIVRAGYYRDDSYFGSGSLYRSVAAGKVFNEFDEAYLQTLTKTDTLAIEEYSYTFQVR